MSVSDIFNVDRTLREVSFSEAIYPGDDGVVVNNVLDANVISSDIPGNPGLHYPVIDLDVPAVLVPSSTPGHSHLYINKAVRWFEFETVLNALVDAGLVEGGYATACIRRERADVRLPWVQK